MIEPVYRVLATLGRDAVLVEFPFGDSAYDLRYMEFSSTHGRRMRGGFSGVFPASWVARRSTLEHPLDAAWAAHDGATHAIVHTRARPACSTMRASSS